MKVVILNEKKAKVSKTGQKRVSKKIGHLVGKEKMDPDQAAAIAYSMEDRGELKKGGKHSVDEELQEMYSTSTQMGGHRAATGDGEKEHKGHVERSEHQGLINVMQEQALENILDEIEYDIGKIKPKGYLNRKFWDKNRLLDRKTRTKLLEIAKDFAEQLDIEDKIIDITFTGSLASYNWHKKSDIDLHLVVNYEEFDGDVDMIKNLMTLERSNWNRIHNIMIKGHEVEIYIQDEDEDHHANGVYSIERDEWIIKPSPASTDLDTSAILKKAETIEKDIDLTSELVRSKRYQDALDLADNLKEKIKNLRTSGLNKEGIYSIENLAFKLLRNSQQIDKLYDLRTKAYDEMMSIADMSREIDINLLDEDQLNEKLMLKPGPNGWDLYSKLVAEAYLAAPKFESKAVSHFEAMVPFVIKMFERIKSKVNVEFVDYHAYSNVEELRSDVFNNQTMKIATVDAEHDVFDPETNAKFRAVHDYMSHIQAIGSRGTDFSLKGEIQSYNTHLKTMPPAAWPALFTEIVGQASTYFYQGGQFAEQKIALLDGFDYENIRVVEGYDIVNKELVKSTNIAPIESEPEQMVAESSQNQGREQHIDAKTQDSGKYQTSIKKSYNQDRADYLFLGNNKESGGGEGHSGATKTRSKSAPPMAEGENGKNMQKIRVKINKKG